MGNEPRRSREQIAAEVAFGQSYRKKLKMNKDHEQSIFPFGPWEAPASCIFGRQGTADRDVTMIAAYYFSIGAILDLLVRVLDWKHVIAQCIHRHDERTYLIDGVAASPSVIDLSGVLRHGDFFGFDDYVNCDLLLINHSMAQFIGEQQTQWGEWAMNQRIPLIDLHDNQFATFANFSRDAERAIFWKFVQVAGSRKWSERLSIEDAAWGLIRDGLFAHGWTIRSSASSESLGDNSVELWGGTLAYSVQSSGHRLSSVNKQLVLRCDSSKRCSAEVRAVSCPLDDVNGQPLAR